MLDIQAIVTEHAADLDAAYSAWREQVLAARSKTIRAAKQAAKKGQPTLPLGLILGALPPELRPASWGRIDGASGDSEPMRRDRNGNAVHEVDGRIVQVGRPAAAVEGAGTETITEDWPAGPKSLTVRKGHSSGDEPGDRAFKVDRASMLAEIHGISLREAREWIADEAEDTA